jgi:hypothetical protein
MAPEAGASTQNPAATTASKPTISVKVNQVCMREEA